MLVATNARWKWAAVKKNWTRTHATFPSKNMKLRSFWKFHIVVMQNNAKEMYKKNLPHVQNCFFANYTCCCFSPFSSVAFAIYHYIILCFVWTNYKYHQELRVKPWLYFLIFATYTQFFLGHSLVLYNVPEDSTVTL